MSPARMHAVSWRQSRNRERVLETARRRCVRTRRKGRLGLGANHRVSTKMGGRPCFQARPVLCLSHLVVYSVLSMVISEADDPGHENSLAVGVYPVTAGLTIKVPFGL